MVERSPATTAPSGAGQAAAGSETPARTSRREREPRLAPAVASREGRSATIAARVFLRGYLPYSYGRVDADRVRGAAPSLVRVLREAPPRVAAGVARSRPRLLS